MRTLVSWLAFTALIFVSACCAQSCDDIKPTIVLVSQDICPNCKPAKKLLERMEAKGEFDAFIVKELNWNRDRKQIEATGAVVTATPTVLLLDRSGQYVTSLSPVSEAGLKHLAEIVPVECYKPVKIVEASAATTEAVGAPGDIVITWDLATQYRTGDYNGTFAFYDIDYALNSLGRHKKITFRRVTRGGQYHVVQGNYQLKGNPNAAEWTSGNTTVVSPIFRFANPVQCNMCTVHEYLHLGGFNHHAQDGGIMGPNGGYLLNPNDWNYISRFPWRSASRPNQEPDWFKAYLSHNAALGTDDATMFPLLDVQAPN
jgi:hypothetical protein